MRLKLIIFLIVFPFPIHSDKAEECLRLPSHNDSVDCVVDALPLTFYLSAFNEFKRIYKKSYPSLTDEAKGVLQFRENYQRILKNNLKTTSYKMKVNEHADLSSEEFARKFLSNFN